MSLIRSSGFWAAGAASGWVLVGSTGFTLAAASGTTAVALPGTVQSGDIAIVAWASDFVASGSGVDTDQGYTFHYEGATDVTLARQLASKKLGAAETTVDVTSNASTTRVMAGVIQVWRGADQITHIDVTSPTVATGASGMPDAPSVTPANVGALVIAFGALDDDDITGVTAPSGYTNLTQQNTGAGGTSGATVMLASKEVSTTDPENPAAFGGSGDDDWAAGCVVLRKAS